MLETAVLVGLAAAGIALVVRAVTPLSWQIVKPIACDLCMSWWGSLAVALIILYPQRRFANFIVVFAAIPVSVVTLKLIDLVRVAIQQR